jgi:cell division protein FtsX
MKTILPKSGREWFGLVSFALKCGIVSVLPVLLVWYFHLNSLLRSLSQSASTVWYETHDMITYTSIGYWTACGCLIVMGVIEMFLQRRRQAVGDFAFAALAFFVAACLGPLSAEPR